MPPIEGGSAAQGNPYSPTEAVDSALIAQWTSESGDPIFLKENGEIMPPDVLGHFIMTVPELRDRIMDDLRHPSPAGGQPQALEP